MLTPMFGILMGGFCLIYKDSESEDKHFILHKLIPIFSVCLLISLIIVVVTPDKHIGVALLKEACIDMASATDGKVLVKIKEYEELKQFKYKHRHCKEASNEPIARNEGNISRKLPDTTGHSIGTGEYQSDQSKKVSRIGGH
jgi:hypothetical protein